VQDHLCFVIDTEYLDSTIYIIRNLQTDISTGTQIKTNQSFTAPAAF